MSFAGLPPTLPSHDIDEVIAVAGRQFNERKIQAPQIPDNHRNLQSLLTFILALFESIYLMVTTIAVNLSRRISAVEDIQVDDEEETTRTSATTPVPSSVPSRNTKSTHSKRCQKCHARGHDATKCQTANPTAMRRRVASNSRIAKEARAQRSTLPTISASTPSFIPSQYSYPTSTVIQPPVNFANLVADATELRRRTTQSMRDRRMNRRQHTT